MTRFPHLLRAVSLVGLGCFALTTTTSLNEAAAGAWTQPEGNFLFVLPFEYSFADEQFDDDGDTVDRPQFSQYAVSPYLEYGLTDYLTLGAQPNFRWVEIDTPTGTEDNAGLSDAEVFGRLRLWTKDAAALSFQALAKIPIEPDENDVAALGYDQWDAQGSVQFGNSVPAGSGRIFYNVDLGYRHRFEDPSDEVHANAFIGWAPPGRWSFILASSNTIGLSDEEDDVLEALTARPDFTRYQLQLSTSYRVSENISLVAGGTTTIAGRDVGVTHGVFVSLVFNLSPTAIFGPEPYF